MLRATFSDGKIDLLSSSLFRRTTVLHHTNTISLLFVGSFVRLVSSSACPSQVLLLSFVLSTCLFYSFVSGLIAIVIAIAIRVFIVVLLKVVPAHCRSKCRQRNGRESINPAVKNGFGS